MKKFRKSHKIAIYIVLGILLTWVIVFLWQANKSPLEHKAVPIALNGVLDLTNWDLEEDGIVNLTGEWEFYWDQLLSSSDFAEGIEPNKKQVVTVPDVWTDYALGGDNLPGEGFATYRLKVISQGYAGQLAIKIPDMSTSCKVMIDNQNVASCGIVADHEEAAVARYHPQVAHFQAEAEEFDIIVQVSNYLYDRGGMWYAIDLGMEKQIRTLRENEMAMDLILLGIFFFMGSYHLAIYVLHRREKVTLYFATGCLIGALRLFVVNDMFILNLMPDATVPFITAIIYFTYYGGVSVLTLYLRELYPGEISLKLTRAVVWVSGVFMLTVLLLPLHLYTHMIRYYHLFMIVIGLYLIASVFKAVWRQRDGATLQFFAITFFVLTIFHDILFNLFYISEIINHANTIQFLQRQIVLLGLFVLVFVQVIVLAKRFSKAFQTVEQMSEKLLSLDRLKDEFLQNTSHELKTPLHGIMNLSQSMLEGSTGKLNVVQVDNLSQMVSVSRRLTNLINDILDFTKLKNGEITLERRSISLQAAVQANYEVFRHIIANKPLQLVVQIPDHLPHVYVDENRLLQILYNLIGNAIKFTEQGEITVFAVQRGDFVEVSVKDTGIGIPKDKQEIIFRSFEETGTTVSREYGGTGLGLLITRRLVELNGGGLSVESTPGEGSVFVFTLPIMQADMVKSDSIQPQANYVKFTEEEVQSQSPQINTYAEDFKGYTILAVDDEPANLQVIMNVFAQEPCQIITAQHGEQALHILADNPHIDLVILDVMMPGLSGYEICRWIRERYNLFELPILLVTVKNDLEDLTSGFAAGANDFLVKPFYTHELKARAETLIKLKKTVEQAIQAETSFLRAQIKPHFLYNAMNTIVSICPRDPKKAVELLTELSHYLRANFDFDNTEKLVSFDKELELIDSYLFIEKARFAERLQVVYELESDLPFFLPPLSIQPLVENAVRHGLMSKLEGGTVTIRVRSDEHYAIVFIEDDGVGMSEQKQRELFLEGHVEQGIGLKNIQMRMKRMFGYGLDIESELGKGTKVIIKFAKVNSVAKGANVSHEGDLSR